MTLSNEIVTFAGAGNKFYERFADYHFHKSDAEWGRKLGDYDHAVSLNEKHEKVNEAFFAEIERLSNCARTAETLDAWMANPMVRWANMAIVNASANAVLPAYVTSSLSPFVEFRTLGYGDVFKIKVMPRTLYTVSKGAHGSRTTFRQKKYAADILISPVEHIVTVYVDMYRVLAGKEDLADAIRAVVLSIELDMNKEAVAALNAGLSAATYPRDFVENGAFDSKKMIALCQRVQAYNSGIKPVIMGTAAALSNVLPDASLGYRENVDGSMGSVKYLRDFYGFDLYELPQIPTGVNYGLALDDNKLYIVTPALNKLVAGCMSNTLTNSNQFYENADITSNFTMRKDYTFEFIGAAYAGLYTITD